MTLRRKRQVSKSDILKIYKLVIYAGTSETQVRDGTGKWFG